ncbi:hypothetical protein KR215_000046, partial [Drosophila sulfurigaster]
SKFENILPFVTFFLVNEGSKEEFRDIMKKFKDEIEKERLEMGEALIGLKTRQKRLDTALRKINNESHSLEEFEAKYKEFQKTEDEKSITVKLLSEFADFKQEMLNCPSTSNADDDTEIVEDDANVCSMYDPWTKGLMLNPVRNTKCGHHYDRDSVMAAIKDNFSVKCPIVGCVSKIFVQPNHLVSNEALKTRI